MKQAKNEKSTRPVTFFIDPVLVSRDNTITPTAPMGARRKTDMGYMGSVQSAFAEKFESGKLEAFAHKMSRVPRQARRCEIYGTVSVVVDQTHARNIFRKIDPMATESEIRRAIAILQERLDTGAFYHPQ